MTASQWGADVPVSLPQPLPSDLIGQIPMGGFTMTVMGLFADLSAADHERMSRPSFAPFDAQQRAQEATPDPADEDSRG